MKPCRRAFVLLAVCGIAASSHAQDSVPTAPGGNDALSAYDAASQRVRYAVDGSPIASSWGGSLLIAPILKASRDTDPSYRTQILGSAAASSNLLTGLSFSPVSYSRWTSAGPGVNPSNNSLPGSVLVSGFDASFAVAVCDLTLLETLSSPTNVIGATVGRDAADPARYYVERVALASSRSTSTSSDRSSIALGGITAAGDALLRVDNFNTSGATPDRVVGDSAVRVVAATRGAAVNWFSNSGGVNIAADATASTYLLNNSVTPIATPSVLAQSGAPSSGLVFDFASVLRAGPSPGVNFTATIGHLAAGLDGHRGNPTYSHLPVLGSGGTVASLAVRIGKTTSDTINAFGLVLGAPGTAPTVAAGSPRAFTLPVPVTVSGGGFTGNAGGAAAFKQYLSQVPFRGGNGQVGVGTNVLGQLVVAATANETGLGDYIVAATATGPGTSTWGVVAYPGMPVLDGPTGSSLGTLVTPTSTMSAPAVDTLGNVYFVATWKPSLVPAQTGVFRAVATANGYRLERLLSTGDVVTGVNSTRPYTISALTLTDLDSLASGAFHSQQLVQQQDPANTTSDPLSIRSFGGLVVNATITYDNAGTSEDYDALLLLAPDLTPVVPTCPADWNSSGMVDADDIFAFLNSWFAAIGPCPPLPSPCPTDFNTSGAVDADDIFAFLNAWFAGLGPCP